MNAETHLVLEEYARQVEGQGWQSWIDAAPLRENVSLSDDIYLDCLKALERDDLLVVGGVDCATALPIDIQVTQTGFLWVLEQQPDRKPAWIEAVLMSARNHGHSHAIAEDAELPEGAVRQLLDVFEEQGLVSVSKDTGGSSIYWRSPQL